MPRNIEQVYAKVDLGMDSEQAEFIRRTNRLNEDFINGDTQDDDYQVPDVTVRSPIEVESKVSTASVSDMTHTDDDDDDAYSDEKQETPEPIPVVSQPLPAQVQKPAIAANGKITLQLDPKRDTISIRIPMGDPESYNYFGVQFEVFGFTDTGDGVNFLMSDTVEIKFPQALTPFYIWHKATGKMYSVCYAGGTCAMGNYKFISLVQVRSKQPEQTT